MEGKEHEEGRGDHNVITGWEMDDEEIKDGIRGSAREKRSGIVYLVLQKSNSWVCNRTINSLIFLKREYCQLFQDCDVMGFVCIFFIWMDNCQMLITTY